MSLADLLLAVGAGALALSHLIYPLFSAFLSLFAKKGGPSPGSGVVDSYEFTSARPDGSDAPILVSPGSGGRLTEGGIRRLVAPLADGRVGLAAGRLLVPQEDESGRERGREAALLQAERIHRGWTWRLAAWEAKAGVPADLDGHPYAVRREFADAGGGADLTRLAKARSRVVLLPGRRGLVGRLIPPGDMAELTRRLVEEKRRGIQSIPRRRFSPRVLLRHLLGNLTALWLALLAAGSVIGLVADGGWFYRLPLALVLVFLLGAAIGGTVFNLGYRSRVYFPLWWLAGCIAAEARAWLSSPRTPSDVVK